MNSISTPNSKIQINEPQVPRKGKDYSRQIDFSDVTERNIIFNQMIMESDFKSQIPSSPPRVYSSMVCPYAPRKIYYREK